MNIYMQNSLFLRPYYFKTEEPINETFFIDSNTLSLIQFIKPTNKYNFNIKSDIDNPILLIQITNNQPYQTSKIKLPNQTPLPIQKIKTFS